jgi:hypothetical protein
MLGESGNVFMSSSLSARARTGGSRVLRRGFEPDFEG